MAKTQDDLVTAVLGELNRIGAGQAPYTQDIAVVTPRIGPILADLAARRITGVIVPSAIPDALFPDLVRLAAQHLSPVFGKPIDRELLSTEEDRLRQLSRLIRDDTVSPLVLAVLEQLEIYGAASDTLDATAVEGRIPKILAELALRNVAYYADADSVPDEAMPDLSRYMAASLASPTLYAVMDAAERRLRTLNGANIPTRPVRAQYF